MTASQTLVPDLHPPPLNSTMRSKRAGILRLASLLSAEGVRQAREAVLRRTPGKQHGTESDQVLARKVILFVFVAEELTIWMTV